MDQPAGTRHPADPSTALERSTCLDRFDRFRVTDWKPCSGTLTTCLSQAAALPAAKITNRNPVQTICGDAFMTQEYVVPWSYRNLVPYDRRVTRIAHLDVSCP
ncbi:hypothetical protein [Streptomyces sp. NBC_01450]|uniref:hypothetical protein n=1 Tax=Streptomyces sp. NBC_01450 TaxID=2903871 RepID=UPI003FCCE8A7